MGQRHAITDAHGRRIELCTLLSDEARLHDRCAISEDRRVWLEHRLKELIPPKGVGVRLVEAVAAVMVMIAVCAVLVQLGLSRAWSIAAFFVGGFVVYGLGGALRRKRLHARHGPRILEEFLTEECCPHCGYDLAGVTPGADGCTICPECSAAWRMPLADATPTHRTTSRARRPVTDHRARPVSLYGLWQDRPRRDAGEAVPFPIQKRIQTTFKRRLDLIDGVSLITAVVLPLAIILPLKYTIWIGVRKLTVDLIFCGTLIVVSLSVLVVRRWLIHHRRGPAIVCAFLAEDRCPACGHDLRGTGPDGDGLRTCTECGAAWRLQSKPTSAE
jgi:hypothetical protein